MPTISFSLNDLNQLIGKKLTKEKLSDLLEHGKAEIESEDKGELTLSVGDTNLPYLWSAEGIARLLKGILGVKKGLEKLKIEKSKDSIIVDKSVSNVRPYIAAFSVKGKKVDEYLLKQIIQLQEKFCHSYGMRRKKVAIGVYSYPKIKFPVYYKATNPESVKFMPLGFKREMTQGEILEMHPTGMEYAWILEGCKNYPILTDSKNAVLSFPPVINSDWSGKIEPGDNELFFEATGTDKEAVQFAALIFAYAFSERGFKVYSVSIKYGNKIETHPMPFNEKVKISADYVNNMLGTKLKESELKSLLEKMRFGYEKGYALVPDYRRDIMHPVDVVEDVAIAYGYNKLPEFGLNTYTHGATFPITKFIDKIRELLVGLEYQEVFSHILANKNLLYEQMNVDDFGTVEISNPMTETYSCARTWILPQLMELLAKSKNAEYPQKVFEEGLVTMKKDLRDYSRVAVVSAHTKADFTEIKQVLDFLMDNLGMKYQIEGTIHHSFIPGRVGRVIVNGKGVAYIGEIHPKVLNNFGMAVPVAAMELNLSDLFEVLNK